jgi:cell division protease FtsH
MGAAALQSDSAASAAAREASKRVLSGLAAKTWFAGTEMDGPRGADGKYADGWHWGMMPYSVRRDLPEWYQKEVERYSY